MNEEINLLRRRFERERLARKQAEHIAEVKSRELFIKSQELEKTVTAEQRLRAEIELLLRAFKSFSSIFDTTRIADHLCHYLDSAIPCHHIVVYLYKEEGFQPVSRKDNTEEKTIGQDVIFSSEALSPFNEMTDPVIIEDIRHCETAHPFLFCEETCSAMIIPLCFQNSTIGYVTAERRKEQGIFKDGEFEIAQALVNEAVISLENTRLFKEVERLSTTDPLTGSKNRRYFNEAAKTLFKLSVRHKRSLSAVMMDIDYFKNVNDTYGHDIGDVVLKKVALTCRQWTRKTDLSARYGGEEFCFLLPETDSGQAFVIAEKLRITISQLEMEACDKKFFITVSVGISECRHTGDSLEKMMKRSDEALYKAKHNGRNCAVIWSG